jgi:hypothetical protein
MGREALLMAACGKKGVGKSHQHLLLMNSVVMGDAYTGLKGRKCLIMDVNDEYGQFGVNEISLDDIALFSVHPQIEIRRVRPFKPDASRMTLEEWEKALFYVLSHFRNGFLLIEDLNRFITDHTPQDLIGAVCTNRHVGLDIVLSYQSIGRINTKIWGNLNVLRFHKNTESVERHINKFPDKYEFMRMAEIMVNKQYEDGNKRFFVYVDMDEQKIRGAINQEMIEEAVTTFIYENHNQLVKPVLLQKKAMKDGKGATAETVVEELKKKFKITYFQ